MRITFDCPDEWKNELEKQARKDGHDNISAVCRKGLSSFLFGSSSLVKLTRKSKHSKSGDEKSAAQNPGTEKENWRV